MDLCTIFVYEIEWEKRPAPEMLDACFLVLLQFGAASLSAFSDLTRQ
jgi:hypothetical protein